MPRRLIDSAIGQRLKQPLQSSLGRLGWELRRRDMRGKSSTALLLRNQGVVQVLDVGANVGQFATQLRLDGFEGDIISVEPNPRPFAQLKRASSADPRWRCVQCAAGEREHIMTLHVTGNSTSSSLLPLTGRHTGAAPESVVTGSVEVPVRPIDDVWAEHGRSEPVLLKLDVQGFELAALRGAEMVLSAAALVKTELSFAELFSGQAGYLDVLSFMHEAGFRPVDIERGFSDPATGRLLQCDIVFGRAD